MKKVAIVTRQMIAGGIEKALISMLEIMPKNEYDVTLFVMARGGEFEQYIPSHIKIKCLYGEEKSTIEKVINSLKCGNVIRAIKIFIYTLLALRSTPGYNQEKYLEKILPNQNEKYDVAIAYHVPASFPVKYVINHLEAKEKIAWIHSDVEIYKENLKLYIKYYEKFDKIYCVSKYGQQKFNSQYKFLSNKTDVMYNIINKKKLYEMATQKKGFNDLFKGKRILTVGRLTNQKGYDIIPKILKKLLEENYNVIWYCIGDGELREDLINEIEKYKLNQNLLLLGTQLNPYPYFNECDIYVQPSRHEGYCITLAEAIMFNKPIITTDFVGAREQIVNNKTGKIVKFNEEEIYKCIKSLLDNEELCTFLSSNLIKSKLES